MKLRYSNSSFKNHFLVQRKFNQYIIEQSADFVRAELEGTWKIKKKKQIRKNAF